VGNYGPAERYQLQVESARFKLVERVNGPQGKTLRKVIVFNRYKAEGNQPQITDYQLFDDASGQEICSARITEVQGSEAQGIVPRRLELRWPAEKLRLGLRLNKVALNPQTPPTLFVRQRMPGVQSIDLATGRPEPQLNALQQAGGRR
ncbi:MAG: hypothetical protein IT429_01575, partial [Gemmataceae bacterium]|nr:hypothetical protein [Gemmataceae bacterium]